MEQTNPADWAAALAEACADPTRLIERLPDDKRRRVAEMQASGLDWAFNLGVKTPAGLQGVSVSSVGGVVVAEQEPPEPLPWCVVPAWV